MEFSFLHISDIHFDEESTSAWISRNEIVKALKDYHINADCLIISGDLFNRGALKENRIDDYKTFLSQLPGHSHTFVVPGNHDVARTVQQIEKGSYNVFLSRNDVVNLLSQKINSADKEFVLTDQEKELIYKQAFRGFQQFSKDLDFQSFCSPDAPLNIENYEVQIRDYPLKNISKDTPGPIIRFVLLNTALIAGQTAGGEEYRTRQQKLKTERKAAQKAGNSVKAAEIALEIAQQQYHYENDKGLILDEETSKSNEGESGRLSLSKEGNRALAAINSGPAVLTIFVGHHGFQFLSEETQKALKKAMQNCQSGIYLCGHAHQARFSRFLIHPASAPRDIEQIQAGVMYKDRSGFAQYSFNYGSFTLQEKSLICRVSSYFVVQSISEEFHWINENLLNCELPLSPKFLRSESSEENTYTPEAVENSEESTDFTEPQPLLSEDFSVSKKTPEPMNFPKGGPAELSEIRLTSPKDEQ